jgi:hypothetical protein
MKSASERAVPPLAASRAVRLMGRIGYGARGLVYFLVGVSAAVSALQPWRPPTGMAGAAKIVENGHGLGMLFVLAVAIGLACLAGWFTVAGLAAGEQPGAQKYLRLADRFGDAIVYIAFIVDLIGFVFGWWRAGGDTEVQRWTAWFLAQAYGRLLVGAVGVAILASGIGIVIWAVRGNVAGQLALPPTQAKLLRRADRFGYSGRGAAVALVGCFLIAAAVHGNPREAHQLGGALAALLRVAYGRVLIGLFAVAFLASGLGDMGAALFRRFDPKSPV